MLCCGPKQRPMVNNYQPPPTTKPRNLNTSRVLNQNLTPKNLIDTFPASQTMKELIVQQVLIDNQANRINQKYQFPASFKKAKLHLRAVKFGYNPPISDHGQPSTYTIDQKKSSNYQTKNKKPKVCPCCSQRIDTENIEIDYPTTMNSQDLSHQFLLNSSAALFFSFVKMAIFYSVILFLVCGAFNLLTSADGNFCSRHPKECTKSLFELISTYNKHKDPKQKIMIRIQNILCLVSVILSIIFYTIYKNIRYQLYSKIDYELHTQDDFTIFVQNIPILDFTSGQNAKQMNKIDFGYSNNLQEVFESTIEEWIEYIRNDNNQIGPIEADFNKFLEQKQKTHDDLRYDNQVTSVSLCFNLSQIKQIDKQRQLLMSKHIGSFENKEGALDQDEVSNQIKALNLIELNLCKQFATNDSPAFNITHFVGKAFVSFEYQHYREHIMQKFQDGSKKFLYKGTELTLSRASHPTDIKWLNMEYTDSQRQKRVITSYLIIVMILVFSAAALIGIDFLKLKGIRQGQDISRQITVLNYSLTIFGSLVTSVINYGISYSIRALSGYEKHQTFTNKISSQIIKTIIAQFINTVLILYLITVINSRPYLSSAGLVVQASTYIVISGFFSIGMNFINIPMWWRYAMLWWKYSILTKQGMEEKQNFPTYQVMLNKDYEFPIFNITQRYNWYLLQIYTCMFYCYLVPVGVLATAIIFGIQYWIDKITLFKFSSEQKELGYFLSRVIFKIFECSLFIFAVGNLIFSTVIDGENRIDLINIISLGIAFIYSCLAIFATPSLQRKLFDRYQTFERYSYSQCLKEQKFKETYWTQNPATMFAEERDLNNDQNIIAQGIADEYFGEQDLIDENFNDANNWYVQNEEIAN